MTALRRLPLGLILFALGCQSPLEPGTERIDAEALVASGAEGCRVRLMINGKSYEPYQLPQSLAVVGNRLHVKGTARPQFTTCQMGPVITVSSAALLE